MTSLSLGASNDSIEDILRKHLSPALTGKGWDALLAALATGDTFKAELAELSFDQLFKSSARGVYLDRRAADDGVLRPPNVGLSDEVFRRLSIKTTARKQVLQVILEVLEAFYGSEATRAHVTAQSAEPYALIDGDTLLVNIDGRKTYVLTFEAADFDTIGAATALEVATVLTRELRKLGSSAYAVAYNDPEQGQAFVRIFSGALGLSGSIQIHGGRSQNTLNFPSKIHIGSNGPAAGTTWTITPSTGTNGIPPGRVRFTWSGGGDPFLREVFPRDYVNIYGGVFMADNRGTFPILDVTSTYFEVENLVAVSQIGVAQAAASDLVFFRPDRLTIQSTGRMATATQGDPSRLDVILPATTQAVSRGPGRAAYIHGSASTHTIVNGIRESNGLISIVVSAPHGMSPGQWVCIDGAIPKIIPQSSVFITEDPTYQGIAGTAVVKLADGRVLFSGGDDLGGEYSAAAIWEENIGFATIASMGVARTRHSAVLLDNGRVLVVGGASTPTSAELYDPTTNTWAPTGSTVNNYESAPIVKLKDGRVLIVAASAEIYNPLTGTWTTAAGLSGSHSAGCAILLDDGRVLAFGGNDQTSEIYNPINNVWTLTPDLPGSYSLNGQVVRVNIGNGYRIMAIGGGDPSTFLSTNTCYLFNPATLTWTTATPMAFNRYFHTASVLNDGRVLVANGINGSGFPLIDPGQNTAEIYDPIANKWTTISSTNNARCNATSILLNSGNVLVSAGISDFQFTSTLASELFNPATSTQGAGGINGIFRIEAVNTPSSLTVMTSDFLYQTFFETGTVSEFRATVGTLGPFIYDTEGGAAITGIESTLDQAIVENQSYNIISVVDASLFPDAEGWLCFGFGTNEAVFPVKYLGRISAQHLLLDPSYVFDRDLEAGTTVTLMEQRGIWTPEQPEQVGSFYLTSSASGRVAASDTIDELVAAGVNVVKTVVYPSDIGLGNEGYPISNQDKISDKILVWGGDDLDDEITSAREE